MREEVMDQIKDELKEKPDWDASTNAGDEKNKMDLEDLIASWLAKQILEQNPNLKGVHSKHSMKMLLEQEAKKTL